jgi:hypothetical protein
VLLDESTREELLDDLRGELGAYGPVEALEGDGRAELVPAAPALELALPAGTVLGLEDLMEEGGVGRLRRLGLGQQLREAPSGGGEVQLLEQGARTRATGSWVSALRAIGGSSGRGHRVQRVVLARAGIDVIERAERLRPRRHGMTAGSGTTVGCDWASTPAGVSKRRKVCRVGRRGPSVCRYALRIVAPPVYPRARSSRRIGGERRFCSNRALISAWDASSFEGGGVCGGRPSARRMVLTSRPSRRAIARIGMDSRQAHEPPDRDQHQQAAYALDPIAGNTRVLPEPALSRNWGTPKSAHQALILPAPVNQWIAPPLDDDLHPPAMCRKSSGAIRLPKITSSFKREPSPLPQIISSPFPLRALLGTQTSPARSRSRSEGRRIEILPQLGHHGADDSLTTPVPIDLLKGMRGMVR